LTTSDGDPFFEGEKDMVSLAKKKLGSPLFAVVLRVGVQSPTQSRQWEIIKAIAGALRLFDAPTANRLTLLENDGYDDAEHEFDLVHRWACQVGVTNTIDHEVGQVRNCFKAGYENVVVISTKVPALKKMESAVTVSLGAEVAKHVTYFLPDAFIFELPTLIGKTIPTQTTNTSHGWVVTTETVVLSREETKMREEKALKALVRHIKGRKKNST
jgi:hypothetical protein